MIVKNLLIRANYRKVVKNRLKLKGFHFKDTFYSNQSNHFILVQCCLKVIILPQRSHFTSFRYKLRIFSFSDKIGLEF